MPINISPTLHIAILLITVASQTGIDLLYTQSIFLQRMHYKRVVLGSVNLLSALIIVMIIRLLYPWMADILIAARATDAFPLIILAVVIYYVLLVLMFTLVRGYLISIIAFADASDERKKSWWNYCLLGSIATLLFAAPSFFIITMLPTLVGTLAPR